MTEINRAFAYKFLARLVERYPDDAIGVLKDMIVDYWFFPTGDGDQFAQLTDMDKKIAEFMADNQKLMAIKHCREVTGMGLKEAKDYVESKSWPTGGGRNEAALNMQKQYVANLVQRVSKEFNLE